MLGSITTLHQGCDRSPTKKSKPRVLQKSEIEISRGPRIENRSHPRLAPYGRLLVQCQCQRDQGLHTSPMGLGREAKVLAFVGDWDVQGGQVRGQRDGVGVELAQLPHRLLLVCLRQQLHISLRYPVGEI